MEVNPKSLEKLIDELNFYLSQNRDSIPDNDYSLLNNCVNHLELFKKSLINGENSIEDFLTALELISKFFVIGEKFQSFFDLF